MPVGAIWEKPNFKFAIAYSKASFKKKPKSIIKAKKIKQIKVDWQIKHQYRLNVNISSFVAWLQEPLGREQKLLSSYFIYLKREF